MRHGDWAMGATGTAKAFRKVRTAVLAACVVIGLAAAGARADSDVYQNPRETAKKSRWSLWPFGKKDTKETPRKTNSRKDADRNKEASVEKAAARPIVQQQGTMDPALAAREQDKVLRRQQVCDRLREIAGELNDPKLDAQAQLLEQRAWFIYEQRTARPGMPGLIPADASAAAGRLLKDTEPRTPASVSTAASLSDRPIRTVSGSGGNRGED